MFRGRRLPYWRRQRRHRFGPNFLRIGCEVTVFYRRERKDMPAIDEETEPLGKRARSLCSSPRRTALSATPRET